MYDVITVGSATVDAFADTDSELVKIKSSSSEEDLIAYPSGTKMIIKELDFKIGGGGTNTAVSFSRLGLKTAYLGKLGVDANGDKVIELLDKENIDFIGPRKKGKTGFSVILDSIEHDRTILTHKGVNNKLLWEQVNKRKLNSKWLYLSSMMGKSLDMMKRLARYANKKGIKIAFNPSSYLIKEHKEDVLDILSNTKTLIFNREEAQLLCGNKEIKKLLKECNGKGPDITIITDGKEGCYSYDGKVMYKVYANNVKVREATGAGDAFASSFIAGLAKGKDLKTSLELGITNAESVIQNVGAKEVLLTYRKALNEMRKNPHKIKEIK